MEQKEWIELIGTVGDIIYSNAENGYTVLVLETGDGEEVTVTGCLPFAAPGEQLTVRGTWVRHPAHGKQFQADAAERTLPTGAQAIYEYLASRVIKGVGPATASVIVSAFGADALDVMEREPEKLAGLKGISMKKALEMSETLRQQLGLRRLMEFLVGHGIKPQLSIRLYRLYGDKALAIVEENPYILSQSEIGGEFADADRLALELGMDGDSAERVAAAILFELQHNTGNGHVFIPREKLVLATSQLIDIDPQPIEDGLDVLLDSGEVVSSKIAGCEGCYLANLYAAETYTAERLLRMTAAYVRAPSDFSGILASVEREQGISYAPMQRKTLEIAANHRVMVLTGGPGTGKTTVIRALIAMFERMGLSVRLSAPTGRAAKRMSELAGREAQTIHRMLEAGYAHESTELVFKRNEDAPLKCDVMIVDECSMIDITLMKALLCALPADCRLILVGDADQLPPVGPGNVFMEILRSHMIPVVRLTEIFRQTADSRIIRYAHAINDGDHPNFCENKGDFFFMRRTNQDAARELIVQLCAERLPKNLGLSSDEIQVLTPTRKGSAGVYSLNQALQAALNPHADGKPEKQYGNFVFRVGDRVMQIRNNYDIIWIAADSSFSGTGVFNGDIGYIRSIDSANELLVVDYDGHLATYSFDMLSEIEHAWAMTVHKSQGSEYRAVILSLAGTPPQLVYRSLLYTAVTRARELLIAVGDEAVARQMIDNHKQVRRYSGLRARLAGENG